MKATIGVYDTHDKAVEAVKELKKAGHPGEKLSILGQAELKQDQMHLKTIDRAVPAAEASIGIVAGSVIGLLSGLGIFLIPGLGFIYGAGAIVGILAGADFGLIGGGLIAILTRAGLDEAYASRYHKLVEDGKFLVIAQGKDDEIHHAAHVLAKHGTHEELQTHGVAANGVGERMAA